ncbi:hypothetical protein AF332_07915 [Sporosarcina globispora]|uniref:Lipoprotein n=1 Tax=Sporosarcina globispora TaxID=1459 RepID=A0A0M0GBB7_SPOGL|nr:hypothetical protein [Sporosarcina globispora]KON86726.1 hypothetical protein AF332_07915 [Sporosarcina globispora]
MFKKFFVMSVIGIMIGLLSACGGVDTTQHSEDENAKTENTSSDSALIQLKMKAQKKKFISKKMK